MYKELSSILINTPREIRQAGVRYIGENPKQIKNLIKMSFSDVQPEAWRAAWVLADLVKNDKEIRRKIQAYSSQIISSFKTFNSPGQVREFLKTIQYLEVNEEDMGILLNICFDWLIDRKADQAWRVYAMQIIYDYSKKEPDLLPELKAIIEQEMEYAKPGFKSRGKRILREIG